MLGSGPQSRIVAYYLPPEPFSCFELRVSFQTMLSYTSTTGRVYVSTSDSLWDTHDSSAKVRLDHRRHLPCPGPEQKRYGIKFPRIFMISNSINLKCQGRWNAMMVILLGCCIYWLTCALGRTNLKIPKTIIAEHKARWFWSSGEFCAM